jgi:hypothetical protein
LSQFLTGDTLVKVAALLDPRIGKPGTALKATIAIQLPAAPWLLLNATY